MKNPIYDSDAEAMVQRPRGITQLTTSIRSMKSSLIMFGIFTLMTTFCTLGAVICGIEMTKEMWVSDKGIIIGDGPVATHQSVEQFDLYELIVSDGSMTEELEDMQHITINTPEWSSKHTIETWKSSDVYDYFQVNTTDGNSLTFNGTALDWNGDIIAEVAEEPARQLLGWKEKFARKVKKKLDSPLCNTQALIDKVTERKLEFATAPACHVGVSAAKIYMHYTD